MKSKKVFFLVWLYASWFAFGTDFQFYPQFSEIPSLSISAITQDARGFMWFGTNGSGIIRSAGNTHKVYTCVPFEKKSLASSMVYCLSVGNDNILWAGTGVGVSAINIMTDEISNYPLQGAITTAVLSDSSGRVWAGTVSGLYVRAPLENHTFIFAGLEGEVIRFLYEDPSDYIFVCTDSGLFMYDESKKVFRRPNFILPENPLYSGRVTDFYADCNVYRAAVWGRGLVFTDADTGDFSVHTLADNRINDITDLGSFVLAGTNGGGLFSFDKTSGIIGQYSANSVSAGLESTSVRAVFTDLNDLLWVGTSGSGLYTCDLLRSRFMVVPERKGNKSDYGAVFSLARDSAGFLWSVTEDLLVKYNEKYAAVAEYTLKKGAYSVGISLVYAAKNGTIYAGTDDGLFMYDLSCDNFIAAGWDITDKRKSQNSVRAVFEDKNGALWVGFYGGGVAKRSSSGSVEHFTSFFGSQYRLSDNYINFIAADLRSDIWIGTNRGLNRLQSKSGQVTSYYHDPLASESLVHDTVTYFYEDSDGSLWFGTASGVSVFDPISETFTATYLLPQAVSGIYETENGVFLIATTNGLYGISANFDNKAALKLADGSQNREFTGTPVRCFDGSVYFPTTRGLLRFTANSVQEKIAGQSAPTIITDLSINGVSIDTSQLLSGKVFSVQSDRSNISVSFTSLDFSPLAIPVFTYMLEGFDNDWISSGRCDKILYTNLNPGLYTFRVKSSSAIYAQDSDECFVSFRIEMPLFGRWYFIVLFVLIIGVLAYAMIRMRYVFALNSQIEELEQIKNTLLTSNRNLEYLSNTDALTGIDNRRSFENVITEIWDKAVVEEQSVSILMIDIDFFKSFNDKNGHVAGDSVLRSVASALRACLENENGIVCRYGGEEFVSILLDCTQPYAVSIAERMRKEVECLGIPSAWQTDKNLSVSIGVFCGLTSKETGWKLFVDNADQALYMAKQRGRNRVCEFIV